MTEIRYANLQTSPANVRVTQTGTQNGPPGGDGWQIVSRLRPSQFMSGTGQYAVIVSGTFGDNLVVAGPAVWGIRQLCLGTVAGVKHPEFVTALPLVYGMGSMRGMPFQFLLLISSSIPDSVFGSSFDPAATELCLWARSWTNGDPQNYYSEFTVADVAWQVWNLDDIPAGEWVAHSSAGPSAPIALPGSINPAAFTGVSATACASGGAGAVWLHFVNYWVRTQTPALTNAPYIRTSITPDGTAAAAITKIGASNRWGLHRAVSTPSFSAGEYHVGGFFVHQHTTSTSKVGFFGDQGGAPAIVERWRHFSVRIDTLPDVRFVNEPLLQSAGGPVSGPWEQAPYVTIERPAPSPGILTDPIVAVQFTPVVPPNPTGYGVRVTEAGNGQTTLFGATDCFPFAEPGRHEAISAMAFGRRTFQTTSPAMQYRVHAVGDPATPPGAAEIWDFTFVQFHPVRDPANITTPPGTKPPPIVVLPGKQSVEAASLPLPPFAPNANPLARATDEREGIQGSTGYRRNWPLGAKPLRQFTVSWGPMPAADAHTLFDFLRSNVGWRYVAPRRAAIAVLNLSNPELAPAGHRGSTVTVEVGVPVFTGS